MCAVLSDSDSVRFYPQEHFRPDQDGRLKLRWETLAYAKPSSLRLLYEAQANVLFHLDEFDILSPDGLIWLLSISSYRHMTGKRPLAVTLPNTPSAIAFLQELNFPALFQSAGGLFSNDFAFAVSPACESSDFFERYSPVRIQKITDQSHDNVLQATLHYYTSDVVHRQLGLVPTGDRAHRSKRLYRLIREIVINIVNHSGTPNWPAFGYLIYRPWPKYPMLRFACADLGPGFSATFESKRDRVESECHAIRKGFLYRYHHPREGILGYYRVLPIIFEFCGRILIRSRTASAVLDLTTRSQVIDQFREGYHKPTPAWLDAITSVSSGPDVHGAHIVIDVSLVNTRRPLDEVY